MSASEIPEPNSLDEDRDTLVNLMPDLVAVESRERRGAFSELHTELARLALLGTDDQSRQSYHETYVEGNERHVLITHETKERIGRIARVVVNDEDMGKQMGTPIVVRDFCIVEYENDLTLLETVTSRDSRHRAVTACKTGPVLFRRNDRVDVGSGKNYLREYPYLDRRQTYFDVMARRAAAQALVGILKPLNAGVTLVPGISTH